MKARIVCLAAQRVVAGAEAAADDYGDLRHRRVAHGVYQLGAAPNDAALLRIAADHETVHILEENDRQIASDCSP